MMPSLKLQISISPSMMHFLIFTIIASGVTYFLIVKAQQAIDEINRIDATSPYLQARREAGITPVRSGTPTPSPVVR